MDRSTSAPRSFHKRSARARKEQRLRAEARTSQRLLQGFQQLLCHRGSRPTKFGKAFMDALGPIDTAQQQQPQHQPRPQQPDAPCRHYAVGRCTWGATCRFSHDTNGTGAAVYGSGDSVEGAFEHDGPTVTAQSYPPPFSSFDPAAPEFVPQPQWQVPLVSSAAFLPQAASSQVPMVSSTALPQVASQVPSVSSIASLPQTASAQVPLVSSTALPQTTTQVPLVSSAASLSHAALQVPLVSSTAVRPRSEPQQMRRRMRYKQPDPCKSRSLSLPRVSSDAPRQPEWKSVQGRAGTPVHSRQPSCASGSDRDPAAASSSGTLDLSQAASAEAVRINIMVNPPRDCDDPIVRIQIKNFKPLGKLMQKYCTKFGWIMGELRFTTGAGQSQDCVDVQPHDTCLALGIKDGAIFETTQWHGGSYVPRVSSESASRPP